MKITVTANEARYLRVLWVTWPFLFMLPPHEPQYLPVICMLSAISISVFVVFYKNTASYRSSVVFFVYYIFMVMLSQYDSAMALFAYASLLYMGVKHNLYLVKDFVYNRTMIYTSIIMFLCVVMRVSVHSELFASYRGNIYMLGPVNHDYVVIWFYRIVMVGCTSLIVFRRGTASMTQASSC